MFGLDYGVGHPSNRCPRSITAVTDAKVYREVASGAKTDRAKLRKVLAMLAELDLSVAILHSPLDTRGWRAAVCADAHYAVRVW